MKKAYLTPTLVTNGTIVRETLSGVLPGAEIQGRKPTVGGSVGFYL